MNNAISTSMEVRPNEFGASIHKDYVIGEALKGPDCFFDAFCRGLSQACITIPFLKQVCRSDAPNLTQESHCFRAFVSVLCHPFRNVIQRAQPEIEGRILSEHFGVTLHVMERQELNGLTIWIHQLIDATGARVVNSENAGYEDPNFVHVAKLEDNYFVPILWDKTKKPSSSVTPSYTDDYLSDSDTEDQDTENNPLLQQNIIASKNLENIIAEFRENINLGKYTKNREIAQLHIEEQSKREPLPNFLTTVPLSHQQIIETSREVSGTIKSNIPATHGHLYQAKILASLLYRGVRLGKPFWLGTEVTKTEKFDDVVFMFKEKDSDSTLQYISLQAKHHFDEEKKAISIQDLLQDKRGDYSLATYFKSYLQIQKWLKEESEKTGQHHILKDLIIYTNADFSPDLKEVFDRLEGKDDILDIDLESTLKVITNDIIRGRKVLCPLVLKQHGLVDFESGEFRDIHDQNALQKEDRLKLLLPCGTQAIHKDSDAKKASSKKLEFKTPTRYRFKESVEQKQQILNALLNSSKTDISNFLSLLTFAVCQPNEDQLEELTQYEAFPEFGEHQQRNAYTKLLNITHWMKNPQNKRINLDEATSFIKLLKSDFVWFNVNHPVQNFCGREAEIKQLHDFFHNQAENKPATVISQTVSIAGMGGIGKSELARKYAQVYSAEYDKNVIWLNAESCEALMASFIGLAEKIGIEMATQDGKLKEIQSLAQDVYQNLCKRKCLFVFDNVVKYRIQSELDDGIRRLLPNFPQRNFHILITTRVPLLIEGTKTISLDTLTEEEALNLVISSLELKDFSDIEQAKKLCVALQRFPLALQQAIAYLKVEKSNLKNLQSNIKIIDYLLEFEKQTENLLTFKFPEDHSDFHTRTILTTWEMTIEKLKKEKHGELSLKILNACAFFQPDDIPIELFLHLAPEKKVAKSLHLLKRYSVLNSVNNKVNLHRLVQLVIRLRLQQRKQDGSADSTICNDSLVNAIFIIQEATKAEKVNDNILIHATTVWSYVSDVKEIIRKYSQVPEKILINLVKNGHYAEASRFSETVLLSYHSVLNPNHGDVLNTEFCKSLALKECGKFEETWAYHEVLLKKQKRILGFGHIDTLATQHNMAIVLGNNGKFREAIDCLKDALQIKIRTLDPDHPSILATQRYLVFALAKQGKLEEAMANYKDVLKREIRILGPNHPSTLTTQRNIASALIPVNQEKYEEVAATPKDMLQNKIRVLGQEHPDVLTIQHNIASTLDEQGKYEEAIASYKDVLRNKIRTLGLNHPSILITQRNMAFAFVNQGKYEEAIASFKNLLQNKILGEPMCVTTCYNDGLRHTIIFM